MELWRKLFHKRLVGTTTKKMVRFFFSLFFLLCLKNDDASLKLKLRPKYKLRGKNGADWLKKKETFR